MKINQRERILEMLRNAPDRIVSCREFNSEFLFHKLSSRISEINSRGFQIKYIKGPSVMDSRYELVFDMELDPINRKWDEVGQSSFA